MTTVAFLPLSKADEAARTIWARAAVEEPDKAREIMDYLSAKPQFESWSKQFSDATLGKSLGNIRAMHNPRHLAGKVQEMRFDDQLKAVEVCIKVLDPVDWLKVTEGGYTGLSIGGGYLKKWKDGDLTRYTPRISEISLVDSPCIPSAKFLELQKSDGSVEEVLLKGHPHSFAELRPPPSFADLHKANILGRVVAAGSKIAEHPAIQTAGKLYGGAKKVKEAVTLAGGVAGLASGAYEVRRQKRETLPPGPRHMQKSLGSKLIEAGEEVGEKAAGAAREIHYSGSYTNNGKTFTDQNPAVKVRPKWGYTTETNKPISGEVDPGKKISYTSNGKTYTSYSTATGFKKAEPDEGMNKVLGAALGATGAYLGGRALGRLGTRVGAQAARDAGQTSGQMAATLIGATAAGRAIGGVAGGLAGLKVGHALTRKKAPADLPKPAYMTKSASAAEREKIATVMREHKEGKLRSWRGVNPRSGNPRRGPKVTDRRQAIAIALSQARRMSKAEPMEKILLPLALSVGAGMAAHAGVKRLAGMAAKPIVNRLLRSGAQESTKIATALAAPMVAEGAGLAADVGAGIAGWKAGRHLEARRRAMKAPALAKPSYMTKAEHDDQTEIDRIFAALAKRAKLREHVKAGAKIGIAAGGYGGVRVGGPVGGVLGMASGAAAGAVGGAVTHALAGRIDQHKQNKQTKARGPLSDKEHAERIAAAKARWLKEGHHDLDHHFDNLHAHASKAYLGRANKIASVQQQRHNAWHAIADSQAAYDKVRAHLPAHTDLVMEVPHAGGLLYNPEGVGGHGDYNAHGQPHAPLYLLHPAEADDFIKKHKPFRDKADLPKAKEEVAKIAPGERLTHIDQVQLRAAPSAEGAAA